MKFLPLIWSGIWRKPGRTTLIFLQVCVAFALFGVLHLGLIYLMGYLLLLGMLPGLALVSYGFVEYGCVFDCATCPHVVRFGYVYNFPQGGEPQILTGFMPGGPSAYNAST